ncbi:MAG: response regulator transcription factor [Bacteroidetes bacterium]|nr:MAG: response regulator transcription factor [Bacteroidota bacterium]
MSIRTLIVDDEPLAREGVRLLLEKDPEFSIVRECGSGSQALESLKQHTVDLLFLDIQMPEMNGFEVLSHIPGAKMPVVIFVTAYDQFAVQAFKVHALDYLLKPFSDKEFYDVLNHTKEFLKLKSLEPLTERLSDLLFDMNGKRGDTKAKYEQYVSRIAVSSKGNIILVPVEEIDWVEAADYYVYLHTKGKSHILRETLSTLEEKLNPDQFIRIHRSSIVRIDMIQEIRPFFEGESVVMMKDGTKLKLGKTYKQKLKKFLHGDL